jgi:hypothetical protein
MIAVEKRQLQHGGWIGEAKIDPRRHDDRHECLDKCWQERQQNAALSEQPVCAGLPAVLSFLPVSGQSTATPSPAPLSPFLLRRSLINDLVRLGFHYRAVEAFVRHERAAVLGASRAFKPASTDNGEDQYGTHTALHDCGSSGGSMYRQALAAGLAGTPLVTLAKLT